MLPVLHASAKGEVKVSDVVEQLANDFNLSAEEKCQLLPSGQQTTFANRVHWAKSYLGKAGLVEITRRAHFKITSRGEDVLRQSPERIDIKFLQQFSEFLAFLHPAVEEAETRQDPPGVASGEAAKLTPEESMRNAFESLRSSLAADLLQRLRSGTPAFFEKAVVQLLNSMGYGGNSVIDLEKALVGGSGDNGIDGVIDQDLLGLDRIYVQAKRYADGNNVGSGAIRDFFGSLDMKKAAKGIFVTTSSFSSSAKETAERLGKRIVLIDGPLLARLMIRHHVGCRVQENLEILDIDEEFFE